MKLQLLKENFVNWKKDFLIIFWRKKWYSFINTYIHLFLFLVYYHLLLPTLDRISNQ